MQELIEKRLSPVRRQQVFRAMAENLPADKSSLRRLLRENDLRFRFLAENISHPFLTLDAELRCTYWNKAAESLTGIPPAEAVGKRIGEIFQPTADYKTALEVFFDEVLIARETRSSTLPCQFGSKNFLFEITACLFPEGIAVLARDIAANRKAEEALQRLAALVESSDDAIFSTTPEGHIASWNRAAEELYGYTESEILGKKYTVLIPLGLRREREAVHRRVLAGERFRSLETQRLKKDGTVLDVSLSVSPIVDASGAILGASSIARNITERKRAELARDELSRRLLNAQEAERARIARELHDGIGQSLALLNIQLQRACEGARSERKGSGIQELSAKLKQIGERVSQLSHQLHSSELEYLGLAVALKGLCREFDEQYGIAVNFACNDLSAELDDEVALAFLRLAQEALQNIAKHSRATRVQVRLVSAGDELTCTITDDGVGFDVNKARKTTGLGLVSMRERMHLIGGRLTIASTKTTGTTIEAKAPLSKSPRSLSAAPGQ